MEMLLRLGRRLNGGALPLAIVIIVAAAVTLTIANLVPEQQEKLLYLAQDYLPIIMFFTLAALLFSGYPVAFILGGVAFLFGMIGYLLGTFTLAKFFNFVPRIWGQAATNLVLVSIPTFIFMGVMMERSRIAQDLLYCVQVLLKRVPGALAVAVNIMGTILAAMTGIIGASVTMMTALALPTMLRQGYAPWLACGVLAAAGTLGILIPPSIMLIVMSDLLSVSVGNMFMAALMPGLTLSALYLIFIIVVAGLFPRVAPPLAKEQLAVPKEQLWKGFNVKSALTAVAAIGFFLLGRHGVIPELLGQVLAALAGLSFLIVTLGPLLLKGFVPPVFLIGLVKASILFGAATPSEMGAVGAFGASLIAAAQGRLSWKELVDVSRATGRTVAMVFFIIVAATCFAVVYRQLGGDTIVENLIAHAGLGSWGLLILIMVIVFFLGFFLDWIEITLIVIPVFAPMIAGLDFGDHLPKQDVVYWFAILMAVNLQTSFLTPPFGFALFYLKGIAPKEVKIQSIYLGIIPFVLLQILGLVMVLLFPQLALWLMHYSYG
ncbi:MAG: TRAP transporter large permease subunit [Gammaproteobacteria bacterium]